MNRFDVSSGSKAAYDEYVARNPKTEITKEQYLSVITTANTLLYTHLLETGETYNMPFGFGPLTVCKYKQRSRIKTPEGKEKITLAINWEETWKMWREKPETRPGKKIYHLNAHSDGYRYKWMWIPEKARIMMSKLWEFKPSREASRALAAYIKKPNTIFKELYQEKSRKKS